MSNNYYIKDQLMDLQLPNFMKNAILKDQHYPLFKQQRVEDLEDLQQYHGIKVIVIKLKILKHLFSQLMKCKNILFMIKDM